MAVVEREVTIYECPYSGGQLLRVRTYFLGGRQYVDLRIFWKNPQGEWKPGKRGVSLNVEYAPELRAAVERLEEALGLNLDEDDDDAAGSAA